MAGSDIRGEIAFEDMCVHLGFFCSIILPLRFFCVFPPSLRVFFLILVTAAETLARRMEALPASNLFLGPRGIFRFMTRQSARILSIRFDWGFWLVFPGTLEARRKAAAARCFKPNRLRMCTHRALTLMSDTVLMSSQPFLWGGLLGAICRRVAPKVSPPAFLLNISFAVLRCPKCPCAAACCCSSRVFHTGASTVPFPKKKANKFVSGLASGRRSPSML